MAPVAAGTPSGELSSPALSPAAADALVGEDMGFGSATDWVLVPADSATPDPFWPFADPPVQRSTGDTPELGSDIVTSSIRTIASTKQYDVHVAQNRADKYCLVVSDAARTGAVSGCMEPSATSPH